MIESVNETDVVAEVQHAFEAYNRAIEDADHERLNGFFWDSPLTVRFGPGEHQFGFAEISTFRTGGWKKGPPRVVERLSVLALGRDAAVTSALFRGVDGRITRQSQTWARLPDGWRIVAAHVSPLPA